MSDLQQYRWNLCLIKKVEDTVVFLTRKVILSVSFFIASYKQKKNKQKHWYLIHTLSDKVFNGNVVNRVLSFLHWGLFKITLKVPLRPTKVIFWLFSIYFSIMFCKIFYLFHISILLLKAWKQGTQLLLRTEITDIKWLYPNHYTYVWLESLYGD